MNVRANNAALVIGSLAIALLLAEAVLRMTGFSYPSFYVHDALTGNALRPGAEGWWRDEGGSFVHINSAGMRDDREAILEKPRGVFRIAVLGDSYVEALQIPVERSFWRLLESRLQECGFANGQRIEVLSFGVSGFSTAQELLALRERALRYGPDLVLLAFLSGNDVRDNSKEIAGPYPRPYFDLNAEGSPVLDTSFRDQRIFRLKSSLAWQSLRGLSDHLRLIQLVNKSLNVIGQPLSAPHKAVQSAEIGLDDHVYLSQPPPAWEHAWQVTEKLIVQLRTETAQAGARFVMATLTNPAQVPPERSQMQSLAQRLGQTDLFYPERRLRALSERERIEAVFLAQEFADFAVAHHAYLHGFANTQLGTGHWNEDGHALTAAIVARYLCTHPQP